MPGMRACMYVVVAVIKICTDTQPACEKVACGWAFVWAVACLVYALPALYRTMGSPPPSPPLHNVRPGFGGLDLGPLMPPGCSSILCCQRLVRNPDSFKGSLFLLSFINPLPS